MASKTKRTETIRQRKKITRGKRGKAERRNKGTTKSWGVLFADTPATSASAS